MNSNELKKINNFGVKADVTKNYFKEWEASAFFKIRFYLMVVYNICENVAVKTRPLETVSRTCGNNY